MADLRETVHNNLANARRMLAGLVVEQKQEIKRLEKVKAEFEAKYTTEADKMAAMDKNAVGEGYDEQVSRVQNLQSKIAATDEAIAQYKMNLQELNAQ